MRRRTVNKQSEVVSYSPDEPSCDSEDEVAVPAYRRAGDERFCSRGGRGSVWSTGTEAADQDHEVVPAHPPVRENESAVLGLPALPAGLLPATGLPTHATLLHPAECVLRALCGALLRPRSESGAGDR